MLFVVIACSGAPKSSGYRICSIGADVPDWASSLGCAHDYEALGYEADPFSTFAHTNTVNVVIDRQDGSVYFLNSAKWWLHFDFVYFVLEGHPVVATNDPEYGAAHQQFNVENYKSSERRYLLGKIVQYLDSDFTVHEMAAGDAADADLIVEAFETTRARIFNGNDLYYRPVSNGQEQLVPELLDRIPIIMTEELFAGQTYQPLNEGVGYGYLRFKRTSQIEGDPPLPVDLLVLANVPNDIPVVSGVITSEFQTPLSHVNVLAKQRGTPNMAIRDAWNNATLRALEGKLVKLEVTLDDFAVEVADLGEAETWWEERRPKESLVPEYDLAVTNIVDLDDADSGSSISIGAKAANFAELMRIAPTIRMPLPAFALPLSAFDAHMTQNGLFAELDEIAAESFSGAKLEARLALLREAIISAKMAPGLLGKLENVLGENFGGSTKLRFRSSTNAEDLPEFSGAGLYSSEGAALEDGIEEAVKTVWASTYNYAAYVEREFYRVDHQQVRMGVLIHPAFVDEHANGVALTLNEFTTLRPGYYINAQVGEVSVTNPIGDATAEQILWYRYYAGLPEYYEVLSRSSLTDNEPVLSDDEYSELASYLTAIDSHFRGLYCLEDDGFVEGCAIDVEWKLGSDDLLYVKQARPLRGSP